MKEKLIKEINKLKWDEKLCQLYPHIYNNNLLNKVIEIIKKYGRK